MKQEYCLECNWCNTADPDDYPYCDFHGNYCDMIVNCKKKEK